MPPFDHSIQTAPAVGAHLGIDRSTLTRAFNSGALKEAAYRSGDTILIDTEHPHFKEWLEGHRQHHRSRKRVARDQEQQTG